MFDARIAALQCLLDPVNAQHGRDSLSAIAREAGCTKAAVSKWVMDFRDQVGTGLTIGKKSSKREVFSRAQRAAVRDGTHSGYIRKAKRQARQAADCDVVNQGVKI